VDKPENPPATDTAKAIELLRQGTPGPWAVEDPMGPDSLWIVQADKPTHEWFPIAVCSMPDEEEHNFTGREVKANLRKIAASPGLVDVLAAAARRKAVLDKMLARAMQGADLADEATVELSKELDAAEDDLDSAIAKVTKGVLNNG